MDRHDRLLLTELLKNGRITVKDLANHVGLSAPAVRERMRRLEDTGVITGFSTLIDPRALGYTLQALVRFDPLPGKLHLVEAALRDTPRVVQCDKVTGEDCFVARIMLRDISELDTLLDGFATSARTNTSIVKATPVRLRPPPLE